MKSFRKQTFQIIKKYLNEAFKQNTVSRIRYFNVSIL